MEDAQLKIIFQEEIDKIGEKIDNLEKDIEKKKKELAILNREAKRKERVSKEWFGEPLKRKKKEKEVNENV